ncbi:MAG: tRNA (adenosine(37)-N6)-threonylcarbamoyltransferase complex transferase subunit TsaD [Candidatus Melainabacteria bacterium]
MTQTTPDHRPDRPKTILAVESSCDETAVAIVRGGRQLIAGTVFSQIKTHEAFGGVIPEVAAREHIQAMNACLADALAQASPAMTLNDVDAFAATLGPGLIGSLLVGANAAKTLSLLTGKPFLGVNHLYGHVASNYLNTDLEPPFLCLLVSGGHTQLIHVQDYATMLILGETLDDAVGECYDKVARIMDLPYPGGPNMDRLATGRMEGYPAGDPKRFQLPRAQTNRPFDFSFSGLKTASMRQYEAARNALPAGDEPAMAQLKADFAASFQHTVVTTLFEKTRACADAHELNTIAIAGGVSANSGLRKHFENFVAANAEYRLFVPPMAFCTDNAAMIGASAYFNPITTDWATEVFSRSA